MTIPVYVAFDPGSRRTGAVAGTWTEPTLAIVAVQKIAPKFEDEHAYITEASAQALEFAFGNSAVGVIIEIGALYLPRPPKLTGDIVIDTAEVLKHTRACQSISTHHEITKRLADNIARLATAHGIPVQCVSRATWVHRLIPHTSGGMTDAMVLAALPRRVSAEGCTLLASKDLRDAAGALLWGFIPAAARKRKSRARVVDPNKPLVPRVVYTGADATIEAKAKRKRDRALAVSRKAHGTVERLGMPCSCGVQHGRGRRPRSCSQAPPSKVVPTPPKRPVRDPVTGLFRREQDVLTALAAAGPSMPGELTTRALPSASVYLPRLARRGFCVRLPDGRYAVTYATQEPPAPSDGIVAIPSATPGTP